MALGIVSLHCDMRDLWLWHLNSVVACGIESPDQGLNLALPAWGARSLSHWATREIAYAVILEQLIAKHEIASTAPFPLPAVWGSLPPLALFYSLACVTYYF